MPRNLKLILILSLILPWAISLPANETAIRKTLADCVEAAAGMHLYAFNYWCPEGYLLWNGEKYTPGDMKEILRPVIEDNDAWDYDSLIKIRADGGRMSEAEKKQALSINRLKKKTRYAVMKSRIKTEFLAWQGLIGSVQRSLKINSVEIKGEQAWVRVTVTNPKTFKPANCLVKMKKINGSWKICSVE